MKVRRRRFGLDVEPAESLPLVMVAMLGAGAVAGVVVAVALLKMLLEQVASFGGDDAAE